MPPLTSPRYETRQLPPQLRQDDKQQFAVFCTFTQCFVSAAATKPQADAIARAMNRRYDGS
jgi:hypothetical protein